MPGFFLNPDSCVILSTQLFFIGMAGLISSQKNIIFVMISLELMLFSASLGFVFTSAFTDTIHGQVFSLFILTVAAAEASIGLALLIAFYRVRGSLDLDNISVLRG